MRFFKCLIFLLLAKACTNLYAQPDTDTLKIKLNKVLGERDIYVKQKLDRIHNLKLKARAAHEPQHVFELDQQLYDEYKNFSYDSAFTYASKLNVIALRLNDPARVAFSQLDMAFILISSGMFKETLETLNKIKLNKLPDSTRVDYYFLKARSYFDLSDFDRNIEYSAIYNPIGIKCLDTALSICQPGTYNFLAISGLKDLRSANDRLGILHYTSLLRLKNLTRHQFAVNASSLSYIYEKEGQQEKSINLLIQAAIADLNSATKETVALYNLAVFYYKKGDLNDAFLYIKQAMADATYYGARHRQVQISSIMPLIEAQQIASVEQQRESLIIYSSIITVLVLFVVAFAVIIFTQLKKLRLADEVIKDANAALHQNNKTLEQLNQNLSVANKIKNEYIGYYFNINSVYIEKLESFQKSLDKKLTSKRYDDAHAAIKNLHLENERQQLFNTFDKIFLQLFPGFIKTFRSLFNQDDVVIIPPGQLLSTEHRIFALIRMGIHDNERIAKLLGYSVNTIYSYKNRIKNKSFVPNDEFEDKIMAIEAL